MTRLHPRLLVVSSLAAVSVALPAAAAPGAPWTPVPVPTTAPDVLQSVLQSVGSPADGSVFAAGYTLNQVPGALEWRNLIQTWDGTAWVTMATPDVETAPAVDRLFGIDGSSATDVWAVGSSAAGVGLSTSRPAALHYDGTAWSYVPVPDPAGGASSVMADVVSLSPSDVWAVGESGTLPRRAAVFHWDGSAWSARLLTRPGFCSASDPVVLGAVTATAGGRLLAGGGCVAAAGRVGFVLERVQGVWTVVARTPAGVDGVDDIAVTAAGDVWAVGTQVTAPGVSRGIALVQRAGTRAWNQLVRTPAAGRSEAFHSVSDGPDGVVVVGSVSFSAADTRPLVLTRATTGWVSHPIVPRPANRAWLVGVTTSGDRSWAVGPTTTAGRLLAFVARS